jgi:hypothetical protein
MSLLPLHLRQEIQTIFHGEIPITDLSFIRLHSDPLHSGGPRTSESLSRLKSRIFSNSPNRFQPSLSFPFPEPFPTSLDRLFGGPLHRSEITSIEGTAGSGKTRLVLKLAHEISIVGKVLFIDSDFTLQPNILKRIESSLGIQNSIPPTFCVEEEGPFTILPVNSIVDLIPTINDYLRRWGKFDLIVIDSFMSLFQSVIVNDGPGSALIQNVALELKKLVREIRAIGIVTNVIKSDSHPPQCFLGRVYGSLWHQRVWMSTKNYLAVKVELIQSPRYPYKVGKIMIENLMDCQDDHIAALEEIE